jgi:hypothetical protein
MRAPLRTGSLVGRPVVIGDVRLGVVFDAVFDRALGRLVGLDVSCPDDAHRFLPYPACEVVDNELAVESALVLLDGELDFYRVGGSTLSGLRGQAVVVAGDELGTLADLTIGPEGEVVGLTVETPHGESEIAPGTDVVVGNHALRPAV